VGSGFVFPATNDVGPGFVVGPNAQFTLGAIGTVPDLGPGMLLVALVFATLLYFHWRVGRLKIAHLA
jgi:hypothetical protein